MNRMWWQLPGPARFIQQLVDRLHDQSVVLLLPEHLPAGLYEQLDEAFSIYTDVVTYTVHEDAGVSPLEQLCTQFIDDRGIYVEPSLQALLREKHFGNHVIWLDGINATNWPAWREFLLDYAEVFRAQPTDGRTVFCAPLVGEMATVPNVPNDIGITLLQWYGCVDRLDMLLYVSQLLRSRAMPELERQLLTEIITDLALWDPMVAEQLTQLDFAEFIQAPNELVAVAEERGWMSTINGAKPRWKDGVVDWFSGEERVHSAYLAIRQSKELEKRIWSAEVRVLFPYVEEIRHRVLEHYCGLLHVPYRTVFGVIEDPADLEISHIHDQLKRLCYKVGSEVLDYLERLRLLRNDLAHRQVVAPERCCSKALTPPVKWRKGEGELRVVKGSRVVEMVG
jgi:hypothetical protein